MRNTECSNAGEINCIRVLTLPVSVPPFSCLSQPASHFLWPHSAASLSPTHPVPPPKGLVEREGREGRKGRGKEGREGRKGRGREGGRREGGREGGRREGGRGGRKGDYTGA